jgi:ATP-dependent helicase HrpA
VLVPLDAFDLTKLSPHLRVTFAIEDEHGNEVARGKDLAALQEQLAGPVRAAVARAVAGDMERSGLTAWPDDLAELPQLLERTGSEHTVQGFPAFVDDGSTVSLRVFASPAEQGAAMRAGVRRLLRLATASPVKAAERSLSTRARLVLGANPDGSIPALLDDCADAAVDALVTSVPWTRGGFAELRTKVAADLVGQTIDIAARVERVLTQAHDVRRALPADPPPAHVAAVDDIRAQFRRLLPTGFVTAAGPDRLPDLARYLAAIARRLELLPRDPAVDTARMARVHAVQTVYDELVRALPATRAAADDVRTIGWQLEELRVSLWAQQLGTPRPVSEKRIYRAIDEIAP